MTRLLTHPFSVHYEFISNLNFHAAFAIPFVGFASPLPFIAGVRFVDARSASRMSFGVNIFGRCSI